MSASLQFKVAPFSAPLLRLHRIGFPCSSLHWRCALSRSHNFRNIDPLSFSFLFDNHNDRPRLCSVNNDASYEVYEISSFMLRLMVHLMANEGSTEKVETNRQKSVSSKEVLEKLRRYGISGILSYGLLNTAYYLTTFLIVWFYVAPAQGGLGYVAAVERFIKVMAMVWAGSQVTKLVRAGGALALAPFVERGLSWFTIKFKFESQGKAFMAIVGFCFGLALVLFFVVTLLWA